MLRLILTLFLLPLLLSCTSISHVAEEYRQAGQTNSSSHTTIVFLIDGLSASLLRENLSAGRIPHVEKYFGTDSSRIARASFPTLTYPNIVSILTGVPVGEHEILGNRVRSPSGGELNYEDIRTWDGLAASLENRFVFKRLKEQNLTSVVYSYPFGESASVHQRKGIEVGIAYAEKNYAQVDQNSLESLGFLLANTDENFWPRFIFVHLIGVDGYAHELGPDDPQVAGQLLAIDHELGPILDRLALADRNGHKIESILTADHGFIKTENRIPLKKIVERMGREIDVLEDNRVASLNYPKSWDSGLRLEMTESLLEIPHMKMSASLDRQKHVIEIFATNGRRAVIEFRPKGCADGGASARIKWWSEGKQPSKTGFQCLIDFDASSGESNDERYFVSALVEYFSSVSSPDAVALPDESADFSGEYRGNHGGLDPREVFVPLLSRNVKLPKGTIASWRLLRILGLVRAPDAN